jgi:predicted metal-dependent phosphoesterase TrpH
MIISQISRRFNYHMHSCYSDGTDTPEQLIKLAIGHGVKSIALTDHETVEGIGSFLAAAEGTDLEAIPGVEISATLGQTYMHILGYGVDVKNIQLLGVLDHLTAQATEWTKKAFEKHVAQKYNYSWEQVLRHNDGRKGLYVTHVYAAMLRDGLFNDWYDFGDFVDCCIQSGGPDYSVSAEQCINVIKESGGKAFLAHPKLMKLNMSEEWELFSKLKNLGVDGVEAYYPEHSPRESNWYEICCDKLQLEISGGTDWHGMARLRYPLYFVGNIHV